MRVRHLLPLVALVTLAVAGPAEAGTTIGHTSAPPANSSCASPSEFIGTGFDYAVVSAGVITSWSFEAGAQATVLTMRTFHPAGAGSYTAVADAGPLLTVPAATGLHTFPARVRVASGDLIGVRATAGACIYLAGPLDSIGYHGGTATPLGSSNPFMVSTGARVDVAATIEPDADGDGYGDETQDLCPSLATTQVACPVPQTTVTKKPKKGAHGPKSKLRFASSVAQSTFTCSLDGKVAKACTSPKSYTCLRPGPHIFVVVARSAVGQVDPTPARESFKVNRERHGC